MLDFGRSVKVHWFADKGSDREFCVGGTTRFSERGEVSFQDTRFGVNKSSLRVC